MSAKRRTQTNPNSLANLKPGSTPKFDEPKKPLQLTVTPTGAKAAKAVAANMGVSLSDLIELIGRGEIELQKKSA